jgi:hypothetical protein
MTKLVWKRSSLGRRIASAPNGRDEYVITRGWGSGLVVRRRELGAQHGGHKIGEAATLMCAKAIAQRDAAGANQE